MGTVSSSREGRRREGVQTSVRPYNGNSEYTHTGTGRFRSRHSIWGKVYLCQYLERIRVRREYYIIGVFCDAPEVQCACTSKVCPHEEQLPGELSDVDSPDSLIHFICALYRRTE